MAWTAPAAGQLTLYTHGSGFDTLLAAYSGTSVSALTPVAASDNDGTAGGASGLLLQTQAGQEYEIAVDGAAGPAGCSANGSTITCVVGTLANGANVLLPIDVTWNSITGPVSITVNVGSDMPDAATANNAAALVVALDQSGDTDAPTLPQWGVLLPGASLAAVAGNKNGR